MYQVPDSVAMDWEKMPKKQQKFLMDYMPELFEGSGVLVLADGYGAICRYVSQKGVPALVPIKAPLFSKKIDISLPYLEIEYGGELDMHRMSALASKASKGFGTVAFLLLPAVSRYAREAANKAIGKIDKRNPNNIYKLHMFNTMIKGSKFVFIASERTASLIPEFKASVSK